MRRTWRSTAAASTVLIMVGALSSARSVDASTRAGQYVAVPAYWSPNGGQHMAMFDLLGFATPTVDIVVVNGPDSAAPVPFDEATAEVIRRLRAEGATVLGYVDTGYLGRTGMTTTRFNAGSTEVADWRTQITRDAEVWYGLYGRHGLGGIFFDQTLPDSGPDDLHVDTYRSLTERVRHRHPGALTVINPGTTVDESYTGAADIIVLFENTHEVYRQWTPPAWVHRHPAETFWHLIHGAATEAEMLGSIALSRERNAGFVYVTDRTITPSSSPWDALPPERYWKAQLRAVARPT